MSATMMSFATLAATKAAAVAPSIVFRPASTTIPSTKKNIDFLSSVPTNGGRVRMMQVWPPIGRKKFETLSYLPDLTSDELAKEVDYLISKGWIPCLEFTTDDGFVYRENHRSPGYYDGRYWTLWKLPMFGCTDSSQVLAELEEAKKAYPKSLIRIAAFDNKRQVQCISFIAYKPPGSL